MTRKKYYITVLILLLAFVVQQIIIKQPDILKRRKTAEEFSNVEIKCLDGSFEPIGYYKDKKPVVLVFWASSSEPSRLALEAFSEKIDEWNKKYEFGMLAVNVGESVETIENARSSWNIKLTIGLDPDGKITRKFGVGALPTIIVIGKDGTIINRHDAFGGEMVSEMRWYISDDYEKRKEQREREKDSLNAKPDSSDTAGSVDTLESEE